MSVDPMVEFKRDVDGQVGLLGPNDDGTKHDLGTISRKIGDVSYLPWAKTPKFWYVTFGIGFCLLQLLFLSITWLLVKGTGIWGLNNPVGWGFAIINFVWWIGIGHAGTLISAILLLLRQEWRTSINRFAETMTIFAVMCAGLCGHGLGATPSAIVNMTAVNERYGMSRRAMMIVPIVGAFLVDIIYQPQTIWFIKTFVEGFAK